jgi:hypothetical protein
MTKRLHHDKPQLRNWQARAAAKTAGLKQYWTGYPCAHGHIDFRLTSNGMCMECARIKANAYSKTEAGQATARKSKLKAQASGKSAAASADWRRRNPDKN